METWTVGGNGNWFRDMNGHRYCVAYITAERFDVARDGEWIHVNVEDENEAKRLADTDAEKQGNN